MTVSELTNLLSIYCRSCGLYKKPRGDEFCKVCTRLNKSKNLLESKQTTFVNVSTAKRSEPLNRVVTGLLMKKHY